MQGECEGGGVREGCVEGECEGGVCGGRVREGVWSGSVREGYMECECEGGSCVCVCVLAHLSFQPHFLQR